MLRRPPPIGTYRPPGSAARMNSAACRWAGDPAGRGPSATWRRAQPIARRASKRSTRAAGAAGGAELSVGLVGGGLPALVVAAVVAPPPLSSPPPNRSDSAPL